MKNTFYRILFISAFLFSPIRIALASEVFFESQNFGNQVDGQFQLDVLLNTQKQDINAFEGRLVFPKDSLEIVDIKDGDTIINFWIQRPKNSSDGVVFSGITPGGFLGERGLLFSVIFKLKKEGNPYFDLKEGKLLKNDGLGTQDVMTVLPFTPAVVSTSGGTDSATVKDAVVPEQFTPHVVRDENIFDGKWFLVFSTQDKDSGISHYEVKEVRYSFLPIFKRWMLAESPHILRDQQLKSDIFVKAIDKNGNTRISKLSLQNHLSWYENYVTWAIITVITAFFTSLMCLIIKRRGHG